MIDLTSEQSLAAAKALSAYADTIIKRAGPVAFRIMAENDAPDPDAVPLFVEPTPSEAAALDEMEREYVAAREAAGAITGRGALHASIFAEEFRAMIEGPTRHAAQAAQERGEILNEAQRALLRVHTAPC